MVALSGEEIGGIKFQKEPTKKNASSSKNIPWMTELKPTSPPKNKYK
jgi:hypothetical protein